MGTPCACSYAAIVFTYFERVNIPPSFKDNLLLYLRFINDIFIVWKDNASNPNVLNLFKDKLNNQCKLDWITDDRKSEVNFLDITVKLNKISGNITTNTFQKKMNLFLYIPAHSTHPPGLIKALLLAT